MTELQAAQATDVVDYLPGLRAYTTPKGIRVLEIDYWADPAHDQAWTLEARRLQTTRDWRREMERDWSSPAGDPYFPSFQAIGREKFIRMAPNLIDGPVFVSLDFGARRPAMTCFQYSPKSDRLWLLREFMPHNILTHQFRDACRVLLGLLPYSAVTDPDVRYWVDVYAGKPSGSHCPPPWFPPADVRRHPFIYIAGKEADQSQANAYKKEDAVTGDIFAAVGMELMTVAPRVLGRCQILGRYLNIWDDGVPGLLIDPQCEETIIGFDGAFCYPEPSQSVPIPSKPKKDGHYENLLDAFSYGVVAVCPEDKPTAPKPKILVGYRGRDEVYRDPNVEEVGWTGTGHLGRNSW